jgi:methionyl-tRNA synthetase
VHGTPAEWKSEENVFFRLSRYEAPLLRWIDENPGSIQPESRRNEVRAFVAQGLRDLSVSRTNLSWGIPFPAAGHTVYVWLDALTNYISALGFGGQDGARYTRYWEQGSTRLHLVGKDILRFHAVYWPALLMSARLPLPTTVGRTAGGCAPEEDIEVGRVARPELVGASVPTRSILLLRDMAFSQTPSPTRVIEATTAISPATSQHGAGW